MMNRRAALALGVGAVFSSTGIAAHAQQRRASQIDVVKIVSFGCPISRASEALDATLKAYVQDNGGKFVLSPFPVEVEATSSKDLLNKAARERVYYASRKYGASVAERVKDSLFKGAQDMGLPLTTYMDVYTWLNQDLHGLAAHFSDIFLVAQEAPAGDSVRKAAYVATQAGAKSLPAYVVIVDGKILPALGPDDIQGGSLTRLREKVRETISTKLKEHKS